MYKKIINKFTFLFSFLLCLGMIFNNGATPVLATYSYTPITISTPFNFDVYLIVKQDTKVPVRAVFGFNVQEVSNLPTTGRTIYSFNPGIIAIQSVAVTMNPTESDRILTPTAGDTVVLDTGESYIKGTASISLSNVSFSKPGIYRVKVVESTAFCPYLSQDTQRASGATQREKYLDIYIADNNGALELFTYVLHDLNDEAPTSINLYSDKSGGYVNELETGSVNFGVDIAGNQASRDKYFQINQTFSYPSYSIPSLIQGMVFSDVTINNPNVDLASAEATPVKTGSTSYTSMSNEVTISRTSSANANFYLRDDQSIVISGVPVGTTAVTTIAPEGYRVAAGDALNGGAAIIGAIKPFVSPLLTGTFDPATNSVTNTVDGTDMEVSFVLTRNGTIPTGVVMPVLGAAVLVMVAGTGLVLKKKKVEEE